MSTLESTDFLNLTAHKIAFYEVNRVLFSIKLNHENGGHKFYYKIRIKRVSIKAQHKISSS